MKSANNSPKGSSSSSSGHSDGFLRQAVAQLIDSDEDSKDNLALAFPVVKTFQTSTSNFEKLHAIMQDSVFQSQLCRKIKERGKLGQLPILKLQIVSRGERQANKQRLTQQDLKHALSRFGSVSSILCQGNIAYTLFGSHVEVYVAKQALDGLEITNCSHLNASECPSNEYEAVETVLSKGTQSKWLCRYEFKQQFLSNFKFSQRVIGAKGEQMKKIMERAANKVKQTMSIAEKILKIRLRGRTSNFLERESRCEADEELNLCVSSKSYELYEATCAELESMLLRLACDYKIYLARNSFPVEGVFYVKQQNRNRGFKETKRVLLDEVYLRPCPAPSEKPSVTDIQQLIAKRDEARRIGLFAEADILRDRLRGFGVCLIDPKKGKNNKQEKTKWKFIGE